MSPSLKDVFLRDVFEMTAIELVSVIKHYYINVSWLVVLDGFYGISTFVGYSTPNPFL